MRWIRAFLTLPTCTSIWRWSRTPTLARIASRQWWLSMLRVQVSVISPLWLGLIRCGIDGQILSTFKNLTMQSMLWFSSFFLRWKIRLTRLIGANGPVIIPWTRLKPKTSKSGNFLSTRSLLRRSKFFLRQQEQTQASSGPSRSWLWKEELQGRQQRCWW